MKAKDIKVCPGCGVRVGDRVRYTFLGDPCGTAFVKNEAFDGVVDWILPSLYRGSMIGASGAWSTKSEEEALSTFHCLCRKHTTWSAKVVSVQLELFKEEK